MTSILTQSYEINEFIYDSKGGISMTKTLSIVKITTKESGYPVLELTDGSRSYFIGPFRKYCFQISGNEKFDGDDGASYPEKFDQLSGPSTMLAEYLRTCCATVLYEFAACRDMKLDFRTKFAWEKSEFRKFIKACFEYVYPELKWPFID